MKEIKVKSLRYGDHFVAVDDEDYDYLSAFTWTIVKHKTNQYVNCRALGQMHRHLLSVSRGEFVDHIDGNGLNNQKSNLRKCTRRQNALNRRIQSNNTTGFKGVIQTKSGRYQAIIQPNRKIVNLGIFDTKIQAAKAYNDAALKYFGEFAFLNNLTGESPIAHVDKSEQWTGQRFEFRDDHILIHVSSLTHGQQAIVIDTDDYDRVKNLNWSLSASKRSTVAAICSNSGISMHRLILGVPEGTEITHIDGNKLNNRKLNLLPMTSAQKSGKMKMLCTNTSGFRGVRMRKGTGRYEANITIANKSKYLGTYDTIEQAAEAYNNAAINHFGKEFASLNSI